MAVKRQDLRGDQTVQRKWCDCRIGVDHENVFVEGRIDTDNVLDLMVNLKFQWIHRRVKVNLAYGTCQYQFLEIF